MVSYIKNLDMCAELQTFSFFGDINKNKELHQYVKKNYLKSSTLIYKNDSKENYLIVCKNQTCSNKIKNIEELKSSSEKLCNLVIKKKECLWHLLLLYS